MRTPKPKEIKTAENLIGGLSTPSKMPCLSFNLPAKDCKVGSKLRAVKGSVCFSCYALKGRYIMPTVKRAMQRRLDALNKALETEQGIQDWVMSFALILRWNLNHKGMSYFRWHDSGDIQSVAHLRAINAIAFYCPAIRFWLPTREKGFVSEFLAKGERFNENLTVRLSAPMVNMQAPALPGHVAPHVRASLVFDAPTWAEVYDTPKNLFACPSSLQANKCGDCRACWLSALPIVYKAH